MGPSSFLLSPASRLLKCDPNSALGQNFEFLSVCHWKSSVTVLKPKHSLWILKRFKWMQTFQFYIVCVCFFFFPLSAWKIKQADGISSLLRTTAGKKFSVGVQKQDRGQFVIYCCTAESEVIVSLLNSLRRLGESTY